VALAEVEKAARLAAQAATSAHQRAKDAATAHEAAVTDDERAERELRRHDSEREASIQGWRQDAASAGIDVECVQLPDHLNAPAARATVAQRLQLLDELAAALRNREETAAAASTAEVHRHEAEGRRDGAMVDLDDAGVAAEQAFVGAARSYGHWAGDVEETLQRVRESCDVDIDSMTSLLAATDLRSDEVAATLGAPLNNGQAAVGIAKAAAERERVELDTAFDELTSDRALIANEPNPGPAPSTSRLDAANDALLGTPLYACVDFAPDVAEADRPGLEAALEAAGILDARVLPEGVVFDGLDASITVTLAGPQTDGPTLASVLQAMPGAGLDVASVEAALAAIPLAADTVRIGVDGSWRLGPLAGRHRKGAAE
jgi:hypothetical protein